RAKVRQAVSEVEQALVRLQSTAERSTSARTAAAGYRTSFDATEARWRGGLASLVELEDARRTSLAAENALIALQHERQAAWVALYRAAGGGWKL
ncbi:MAG: TolC family protein, partial [Betaproteobacteria bacterium]